MKKAIVLLILAAGVLTYADLVFARGGGAGAGPGAGAPGPSGGAGAAGAPSGDAGPGAPGGTSPLGDGTGTGLNTDYYTNPIAGWWVKPDDYEALNPRGYAPYGSYSTNAPYGPNTYPSAAPGVVVAPQPGVVVTQPAPGVVVTQPGVVVTQPGVPAGPLMCPNINTWDPRKC
jgi:hypothetical protein